MTSYGHAAPSGNSFSSDYNQGEGTTEDHNNVLVVRGLDFATNEETVTC